MAIFSYVAKDVSGVSRSGTVDARTKELALNLLKTQGLYVVSLDERRETILDQILSFRGVPGNEVVSFTRQFSTMISAGLPISRALEVLANQTQNSTFKKMLTDVLRSVEGGSSLSSAMGRYPTVFPPTYQALVSAGESSGRMDEILKRLAATMESERDLNSKFKAAMVYPIIVFMAMIGVFVILMVFVVPKLADMYKGLNVPLPAVTQGMIAVSDFMVTYKLPLLIGSIIFILLLRYALKSEEGRYIVTEVTFKLPVFGKINKLKELSQFMRTLSLLMTSAIPIVEALNIVSSVVSSHAFQVAAQDAARQVEKGNPLSNFFKGNTIFPPVVGQMASVGEETGKMDEVLDRVANYYDGEVDHLIKGLSAALEPIILVMLGAMVGFLIISIITPIYKITSAI
ncbi:type II secretion system F family protein [candidate division WWE3 bacterium]|jgi:type IV pilus assembly protein PilC|uniref:Type II secretion system F family protein n=1 Tax=candidate division WWE3 bacterium TaxID=2053526 RepID=A0A3A4ZAH1_UNCKA|nr:MAG: type II secretion system F family protein [candidate division WWE3 bacterium]